MLYFNLHCTYYGENYLLTDSYVFGVYSRLNTLLLFLFYFSFSSVDVRDKAVKSTLTAHSNILGPTVMFYDLLFIYSMFKYYFGITEQSTG